MSCVNILKYFDDFFNSKTDEEMRQIWDDVLAKNPIPPSGPYGDIDWDEEGYIKFCEEERNENLNNYTMKILEIKTVNLGGEDIHTITHQEGWDFRKTKNETGYVRWFLSPMLREHYISLRGGNDDYDLNQLIGEINFSEITKFFNSKESPLTLTNTKKWIGDFDKEDSDKMAEALGDENLKYFLSLYLFSRTGNGYNTEGIMKITDEGVALLPSLKQKELEYLVDNFCFEKQVVMKQIESVDKYTEVKSKVTSWFLKN